jgi:hypothetical protein
MIAFSSKTSIVIDEKNYPKNKKKNEVVTCKACSFKPSKTIECDNCEEEKDLKQFSKVKIILDILFRCY